MSPVSRHEGESAQWMCWTEADSTKTLPCRNSVHPIKSWPVAAELRSLEQNPPSLTKEVKDLVPGNKRYFFIQYASSGLVQLCWCIHVDRFVMLSLNGRVRPLSEHLFKCVDVSQAGPQFGHLLSRMSWIQAKFRLVAHMPMHCSDSHNWYMSGFEHNTSSRVDQETCSNLLRDQPSPPLLTPPTKTTSNV